MTYVPEARAAVIAQKLASLEIPADHTVAVLVAEQDADDLGRLSEMLAGFDVPSFGALFPSILVGRRVRERGALLIPLPLHGPVRIVTDLTAEPPPLPAEARSALLWTDGLSSHVAGFLAAFYRAHGDRLRVFGGGAGSLSLRPAPCLFDAAGTYQDAAVLACPRFDARLGVHHGWERLAGPFVATRCDGNVIHELNWRPALDVYAEVVEADAGRRPEVEGFFDLAKSYPFSMERAGAEPIVRDPIEATAEGALVCVGEVPENVALHVCRGHADALIAAAGEAADDCLRGASHRVARAFITDCVSRSIFLGDRFEEELGQVADRLAAHAGDDVPLRGALTLGEIASMGEGHLEFLNKTCVLATLHEPESS